MRYAFIEGQRALNCVRRMCDNLEVSPAGYYEWRSRPASARSVADAELTATIVDAHQRSHRRYGRPRIHADLRDLGFRVGAKRVARLMKAARIEGIRPRRFKKTTDSAHSLPIAKNVLQRNFDVAKIGAPNRVWAGDITYLATREGWLYLAVVVDLATRKVVGWSIASTMERSLVIDALKAALANRRPASGLLFHSDRGSQYASGDYSDLLKNFAITASMSGKGECWDNAVVESFFGSMKTELGNPVWETRDAARAAVFEYIEIWYNRKRRHSTLGYISPEQHELALLNAA